MDLARVREFQGDADERDDGLVKGDVLKFDAAFERAQEKGRAAQQGRGDARAQLELEAARLYRRAEGRQMPPREGAPEGAVREGVAAPGQLLAVAEE